ncbi:MAG: amidohydrolase family protein, partial [Chloroflexi bacterium]|nr:amidohydrolase family protein [Chloroflexota bacterium]
MPQSFDLLIRRARLRGKLDQLFDIAIRDARIAAIDAQIADPARDEIDARGNLVTESFINPHLHLCKVYTLFRMKNAANATQSYQADGMGKAMNAIELAARVKAEYAEDWIVANVRRAVALAAYYGCTHIRALADVDSQARLEGVKALLRAREEFRGVVEIQVVAFAQDGIGREAGARELMRAAMQLGADVVGGIPWIEYTDADSAAHIQFIFDLAQEFNKDVSMLVDDAGDAGLRTLEAMAVETIVRGWQGRALAHHARAMALYATPYLQKVIALMQQAQLGIVTDPHTGPLHARVKELL